MTVPTYSTPVVDEQNPFYCPSIPAASFLESLRKKVSSESESAFRNAHQHSLNLPHPADEDPSSFARLLDQSISEDDLLELVYRRPTVPLPSPEEDSSLDSIYSVPARHAKHDQTASRRAPSIARTETFSELQGPLRHERSFLAVNEGSFELSARPANRIQYFPTDYQSGSIALGKRSHRRRIYSADNDWDAHIQNLNDQLVGLEDALYGPPIGTESPRGIKSFISRLDQLLPGIRLKEKLYALEAKNHQRIVNILASDGNLDGRVLNMLRQSEIESLDLSVSAVDELGLNLGAQDLLQVLGKPNSFLFLSELSLSGTRLYDADIMYIHHLPRLASLWLGSTGIGNEAIYLLTSLKRSLVDLDVAYNPRINDDAVPALLVLVKLQYLSLLDTGITMSGARRLAAILEDTGCFVEVEVPRACEEYIGKLAQKYCLSPTPPMVTDPAAVIHLSTTALKQNLAVHAKFNPDVSTGGTQRELAERLKTLLETRSTDLLVRKLVWQKES